MKSPSRARGKGPPKELWVLVDDCDPLLAFYEPPLVSGSKAPVLRYVLESKPAGRVKKR